MTLPFLCFSPSNALVVFLDLPLLCKLSSQVANYCLLCGPSSVFSDLFKGSVLLSGSFSAGPLFLLCSFPAAKTCRRGILLVCGLASVSCYDQLQEVLTYLSGFFSSALFS